MNTQKAIQIVVVVLLAVSVGFAAEEKKTEKQPVSQPMPQGIMFSTNAPAGQAKTAPFSSEISADFIKKVMETSARIEECKKQIAERQSYLYKNNPEIKAYREEMIAMQAKINKILEGDKELAELRQNRDILWTTMPVLPRGPENRMMPAGMRTLKTK
jgi:soluble cytochrome b562